MSEVVGDFEGNLDLVHEKHHGKGHMHKIKNKMHRAKELIKDFFFSDAEIPSTEGQHIDSRDVQVHQLFHKYTETGSKEDHEAL